MIIDLNLLKQVVSSVCKKHLKKNRSCFGCPFFDNCEIFDTIENEIERIIRMAERAGYEINPDDVFKD